MASAEWYYAKEGKQLGPISPASLRQLAQGGAVTADDLVWREGMDEWLPAGKVRGLFDNDSDPAAPPKPREIRLNPAPPPKALQVFADSPALDQPTDRPAARHPVDLLLEVIRRQFGRHFIESTAAMFTTCGTWGLSTAMALVFAFGLIAGVRLHSLNTVLTAIAWAVGLAVLHYAAARFCREVDQLNRATSGTLVSTALMDSFAVLAVGAGMLLLLGVTVLAVQMEDFLLILPAVAAFILCQFLAVVALNPTSLNLTIAPDTPAGEEAIGMLSLGMKILLQLVPVAFGVGVIWGVLHLVLACALAFATPLSAPGRGESEVVGEPVALASQSYRRDETSLEPADDGPLDPARRMAATGTRLVSIFALLPLAAYILFVFCHLFADLASAVLSLPSTLDKLTKRNGNSDP